MTPTPPDGGPRPRPAVAALPAYVPGRPPPVAADGTSWKLSSNELPFPPLPQVLAAATAALDGLGTYPDASAGALRSALAARVGAGPEEIVVGNGSVALLFQVMSAFCGPGDEVVHAWRSFEAYPIAVSASGATGVPVPLDAAGRHDLAAMRAALSPRTRVVLLCSPNNPTGPALSHSEVAEFVAAVPREVLVVLDEAYAEFVTDPDPLDGVGLALANPHVLALRTLSKAWGLAGMRVGWGVGAPGVVAAVAAVGVPFALSAAAQAAALAALDLEDEVAARVGAVVAERDRVTLALAATPWAAPSAQGNFVWLPLGSRGEEFVGLAAARGVAVRPFPDGVRVSIGTPAANDRVIELVTAFD